MSYEWSRVTLTAKCAFCGKVIADGEPVLLVTIEGRFRVKKPFTYCVECRGPAPPGLPELAPRQPMTKRATSILGVGMQIRAELERRLRPSAQREPGEEG